MPSAMGPRVRWLAAVLTLCSLPSAPAAEPGVPAGTNRQTLPQPVVMTFFFPWYRFVPNPDGTPDPTRSEHFFNYDAFSGARPLALADDFPETAPGDPPVPYRSIVDWNNPAWYEIEFSDMHAAGIDVALMDAWPYLPVCYYKDGPHAISGWVSARVAADTVRAMRAAGKPCPGLAMFWESGPTSHFDLTTGFNESDYSESCSPPSFTPNAWAAWLQVREWFRSLGATNEERAAVWGTVGNRPVIVNYYPDSVKFTQQFWDWLSDRFKDEFGVRPYIILNASWTTGSDGNPVRMDAVTTWNAAINGPTNLAAIYGGDTVVSVGPGYDSTVQPFRWQDPIRLREDGVRGDANETGTFYDYSWQTAMAMHPSAILIETWNERHEGTSIARSTTYGDRYIQDTARYAKAFHSLAAVPATTALNYPHPSRKRIEEGYEFAGRSVVRYTAANDSSLAGSPVPWRQASTTTETDGGLYIERADNGGRVSYSAPYLYSQRGATWSYLHVQVADGWAYDIPDNTPAIVRLTYIDDRSVLPTDPSGTLADIFIEYDSWNPAPNSGDPHAPYLWGNTGRQVVSEDGGPLTVVRDESGNVIYQTPWGVVPLTGDADAPQVKTIEWTLMRPRFGNRQNTGADFRIALRLPGRTTLYPLRILSVEVEIPGAGDLSHYSLADAVRALEIAMGTRTAAEDDRQRLNVNDRPGSADEVTLHDALDLLRRATGVEANP